MMIRRGHAGDAEAMRRIWREGVATPDLPLATVDYFAAKTAHDEPFGVWVAERDGHVVAWQSLLPFRNSPVFGPLWAESSTYVAASERSRGVGVRLVQVALEAARASPLHYVFAWIYADNRASQRMAEHFGFQRHAAVPEPAKPTSSRPMDTWVCVLRP